MGESDLGSEQSLDAQTPRPSEKDEAVLSREVSKVGRNAATEEVEKAPPERRSHRTGRENLLSGRLPEKRGRGYLNALFAKQQGSWAVAVGQKGR